MMVLKTHSNLFIIASFLLAYCGQIVPLPESMVYGRPEFVMLLLIYWILVLPERMGIAMAWCLGIMVDVLKGALLGQHALAMIVVTLIVLKLYQRLRVFPWWQQAACVFALLILYQALVLWVYGIIGQDTGGALYWLPSLISALLWPLLVMVLSWVRQRF